MRSLLTSTCLTASLFLQGYSQLLPSHSSRGCPAWQFVQHPCFCPPGLAGKVGAICKCSTNEGEEAGPMPGGRGDSTPAALLTLAAPSSLQGRSPWGWGWCEGEWRVYRERTQICLALVPTLPSPSAPSLNTKDGLDHLVLV